jgi:hypothetical protein
MTVKFGQPVVLKGRDLLTFPASYIAHQCYCISAMQEAGGIAFSLFQKFPHANV